MVLPEIDRNLWRLPWCGHEPLNQGGDAVAASGCTRADNWRPGSGLTAPSRSDAGRIKQGKGGCSSQNKYCCAVDLRGCGLLEKFAIH
jgi:hypothetical protein